MRMLKMKYILFAAFLLSAAGVSAQKAERDYIRKGNRLFNDSVFVDAELIIARLWKLILNLLYPCTIWEIRSHNNKSFRKPWSNMILPAK